MVRVPEVTALGHACMSFRCVLCCVEAVRPSAGSISRVWGWVQCSVRISRCTVQCVLLVGVAGSQLLGPVGDARLGRMREVELMLGIGSPDVQPPRHPHERQGD